MQGTKRTNVRNLPVRKTNLTYARGRCAGTSGFVQLAWDEEDNTQVAIKFVARGSAYLSRAAEREILNHRLLTGHAHIVQFKEVRLCPAIS